MFINYVGHGLKDKNKILRGGLRNKNELKSLGVGFRGVMIP